MTLSSTATFFHALYLYFSYAQQPELVEKERKWTAVDERREETGCTNLEVEGARLCGLGEVFAGTLLVVCVELEEDKR